MNQFFYLVQQLPYDNWEKVSHFDSESEASNFCDKLIYEHSLREHQFNNFRVHAVNNTQANREWYGI
jgi:hypothetical protein